MLRAAFIILLIALLPSHARAEAKIALLVGNQDYNSKVGRLKNPHEDVALVGAALKQLGFQVTILKGYRDLDIAIKRFITDVRSMVAPAGSFTMGSPPNEPQRNTGEDQVRGSILAPFAVGRFAVTFDEWDACVAAAVSAAAYNRQAAKRSPSHQSTT
jgi:hypothetical protein